MNIHEGSELQSPAGETSILLQSGFKYFVEIHPSKVSASSNLGDIPLNKRNCFMHWESFPSSLLKKYNSQSCKVEKYIERVVQKQNCIPWDAPYTNTSTIASCNEDISLRNLWSIAYQDKRSDCLEACEDINYSHSVTGKPIHAIHECNGMMAQYSTQNMTPTFYYPNTLYTLLSVAVTNEPYNTFFRDILTGNPCLTFMKNSIIVKLRPQRTPVHVVHMQRKVSFTSQVATFGKIAFSTTFQNCSLRWTSRPVHGNESFKSGGGHLLDFRSRLA